MRWDPSGTHTCSLSRRPPQGYAQQHKALWAPNDAAWASFDSSPSQALPACSFLQHLHRRLGLYGGWWSDLYIFISPFSPFFSNEACSTNEDQQNPWCVLALGETTAQLQPAWTSLILIHYWSQAVWRLPKQMELTYPLSSPIIHQIYFFYVLFFYRSPLVIVN